MRGRGCRCDACRAEEGAVKALAVTVSNRAAAGAYEDRSGPILARLLAEAGFSVDGPLVVPDGEVVMSDLVPEMLAIAQARIDGTPNVSTKVLDLEELD